MGVDQAKRERSSSDSDQEYMEDGESLKPRSFVVSLLGNSGIFSSVVAPLRSNAASQRSYLWSLCRGITYHS